MKKEIDLIKKLLAANPDLRPKNPIEELSECTRFREDMGFDSLALASLFYELQETYPHIEESEIQKWATVNDCIKSLQSL